MKSILFQQQQSTQEEPFALKRNMEMLACLPFKTERKDFTVTDENYHNKIIDFYKNTKNKRSSNINRTISKESPRSNKIMNNSDTVLKKLVSNNEVENPARKSPMSNTSVHVNNTLETQSPGVIVQKENIADFMPTSQNSKSLFSIVSTAMPVKKVKKSTKVKDLENENIQIVASLSTLARRAATTLAEDKNNTKSQTNQKSAPKTIPNKAQIGLKCIKHSNRIPSDVLDDLASRFVINVPDIELSNLIRICFQIELAHWFYLDFFCTTISKHQLNTTQAARKKSKKKQLEEIHKQQRNRSSSSSNEITDISNEEDEHNEQAADKDFPKHELQPCGIKYFALQLFQHIPFLRQHSTSVDKILEDWKNYKLSVPTFGAILISEDLNYCLLVQSYFAKTSWGFPKGKVNENEDPVHCATREVYEETGYDISSIIDPSDYIEAVINYQYTRLYIVRNVSLTTEFAPRTRYEIRCCDWFPIDSLPVNKSDALSKSKLGIKINSFFMIMPFVKRLKRWVSDKRASLTGIVESTPQTPSETTKISEENTLTHSTTKTHEIETTTNTKNLINDAASKITAEDKNIPKRRAGHVPTTINNTPEENSNYKFSSRHSNAKKQQSNNNQNNNCLYYNNKKYDIQASKSAVKIPFRSPERPRHKSMGDLDDRVHVTSFATSTENESAIDTMTLVTTSVMQCLETKIETPSSTKSTQHNRQSLRNKSIKKMEETIEEPRNSVETRLIFRDSNLTHTPKTVNEQRRKNVSKKKNIYRNLFIKSHIFERTSSPSQEDQNNFVFFSNNKFHAHNNNKQKISSVEKQRTRSCNSARSTPVQSELTDCLKLAQSVVNNTVLVHNSTSKLRKSTARGDELLTIAAFAAGDLTSSTKRVAAENEKSLSTEVFSDWDLDGNLYNSSTEEPSESLASCSYSETSSSASAATDSPVHSLSPSPTSFDPQIHKENQQFKSIMISESDMRHDNSFLSPITTSAELEAKINGVQEELHLIDKITINAWMNFAFTKPIMSNMFY